MIGRSLKPSLAMDTPAATATEMEIDLRALFSALLRKLPYILVFVLIVAGGTYYGLSRVKPVYSSADDDSHPGRRIESRPDHAGAVPTRPPTPWTSRRSPARCSSSGRATSPSSVAAKLDLASKAEFNPALRAALAGRPTAGQGRASAASRPARSRTRCSTTYYKKLSVYAVDNSRVIVIDFESTDPALAADAANAIADGLHRAAARGQARLDRRRRQISVGADRRVAHQGEGRRGQGRDLPQPERPVRLGQHLQHDPAAAAARRPLDRTRQGAHRHGRRAGEGRPDPRRAQGGRDAERSRRAQLAADPAAGRAGGGAALAGRPAFGDARAAAPAHEGAERAGRRPRPADRGARRARSSMRSMPK